MRLCTAHQQQAIASLDRVRYTRRMKTIHLSAFQAQCLALVEEVAKTGEPVTILQHGHPGGSIGPLAAAIGSVWSVCPNGSASARCAFTAILRLLSSSQRRGRPKGPATRDRTARYPYPVILAEQRPPTLRSPSGNDSASQRGAAALGGRHQSLGNRYPICLGPYYSATGRYRRGWKRDSAAPGAVREYLACHCRGRRGSSRMVPSRSRGSDSGGNSPGFGDDPAHARPADSRRGTGGLRWPDRATEGLCRIFHLPRLWC